MALNSRVGQRHPIAQVGGARYAQGDVTTSREGPRHMSAPVAAADRMIVRGMELEVTRCGSGRPVLLLHGMQPFDPRARFFALLAEQGDIIAPSHPGFGQSPRPDGFETIYDLTRLYLDVLDTMPGDRVTLIGCSFGGWLAAEIAATCCHRIDRLILVDPLGI